MGGSMRMLAVVVCAAAVACTRGSDKVTLPVGGRCALEARDGMARLILSHYA